MATIEEVERLRRQIQSNARQAADAKQRIKELGKELAEAGKGPDGGTRAIFDEIQRQQKIWMVAMERRDFAAFELAQKSLPEPSGALD
jgi:Zn-dependent M32 family carboxypeptidase